jgi:hypothetical protein
MNFNKKQNVFKDGKEYWYGWFKVEEIHKYQKFAYIGITVLSALLVLIALDYLGWVPIKKAQPNSQLPFKMSLAKYK